MNRTLFPFIVEDLKKKIVFITGPRQSGKTTLAKGLGDRIDYFNYDFSPHRMALEEKSWDRKKSILIFDELHKKKEWKRWLKGIYDVEGIPPAIVVTGSAKLDTYRKMGDSLAGRFFQYRLHPFDLKEVANHFSTDEAFNRLWECGGFPEPFLSGKRTYYRRWSKGHLDIILRQDLLDLFSVHDIQSIESLIHLLELRVGQTVSAANMARDLNRDPNTILRWLEMLENLYIIFKVSPYSQKISRTLLKAPKYYFYDYAKIENPGARLENLVACALLKELQFKEDTEGINGTLHFLRTKDGQEIDFLVVIDGSPTSLIEVKLSDDHVSPHFYHFSGFLPPSLKKIQLVKNLEREKTFPDGIEIRNAAPWLANLAI